MSEQLQKAQDVINILTRQRESAFDQHIHLGLQLIEIEKQLKAAQDERDKARADLAKARKKLRDRKG